MEKQFVPYTESKEITDLGFEEKCLGYYYKALEHSFDDLRSGEEIIFNQGSPIHLNFTGRARDVNDVYLCKAPLYQQAFDWFRDNHGFTFTIKRHSDVYNIMEILLYDTEEDINLQMELDGLEWQDFSTYPEAQLECLKKLIELCKKNLTHLK